MNQIVWTHFLTSREVADMKQRHFYPDSGRTVVLGFGSIEAHCRSLQANPGRLGSSLSHCCKNKQPKFSVMIQTGTQQDSLGESAPQLRSVTHAYTHTTEEACSLDVHQELGSPFGPGPVALWLQKLISCSCLSLVRNPISWIEGINSGSPASVSELGDTVLALDQWLTCRGSSQTWLGQASRPQESESRISLNRWLDRYIWHHLYPLMKKLINCCFGKCLCLQIKLFKILQV